MNLTLIATYALIPFVVDERLPRPVRMIALAVAFALIIGPTNPH